MTLHFEEQLNKDIRRGYAVFVAGAGVTINATGGATASSWPGLIRSGLQRCVQLGRQDETWLKLQLGLLERARAASDLVLIAEALQSTLSAHDDLGAFSKWLRETVCSLVVNKRDVLDALVERKCHLATTNYDDLLAKAAGVPAVTWLEQGAFWNILRNNDRGVLHLHGYYRQPQSVVLGLTSYLALLNRRGAQAMQQLLSGAYTLVFVGYGLGLEDPNFSRLIEWMADAYNGTEVQHYQLVLREELDKFPRDLQEAHIDPIAYGDSYDDLAPFLRRLEVGPQDGPLPPPPPPPPVPPQTSASHLYSTTTRCT